MLDFLNSHDDCFERLLSVGHFTGSYWLANRDGTKFLLIPFLITNFSQQAVSCLMFRLCGKAFG
ncbi:MAG: hypothetical protein LBT90_03300 [Holosporaceae bacterium]|nr:hypothetical protein [Holosporaceae bacterium]